MVNHLRDRQLSGRASVEKYLRETGKEGSSRASEVEAFGVEHVGAAMIILMAGAAVALVTCLGESFMGPDQRMESRTLNNI